MPAENYREVPFQLNGSPLTIGGFARPLAPDAISDLHEHHAIGALVSLSGNYTEQVAAAGINLDYYTSGQKVNVFDWYKTPSNQCQPIPPSVYDEVYNAVCKAQEAGLKIAVHCGAGDGRTGTALASLKLRELLEKEYQQNKEMINTKQNMSEVIHAEFGAAQNGESTNVKVTPLVYEAIIAVREFDNPGHHSVESPNDMRTLMIYENKLRQEFYLKDHPELAGMLTFDPNQVVLEEVPQVPQNEIGIPIEQEGSNLAPPPYQYFESELPQYKGIEPNHAPPPYQDFEPELPQYKDIEPNPALPQYQDFEKDFSYYKKSLNVIKDDSAIKNKLENLNDEQADKAAEDTLLKKPS